MDLSALLNQCAEAIRERGADDAFVVLKINRSARGQRIRLTPKSGPYGEIVWADETATAGAFKAAEILRWIERLAVEESHA